MKYKPKLPGVLRGAPSKIVLKKGAATKAANKAAEIKKLFPNMYGEPALSFRTAQKPDRVPATNVGVILSGGQAPGGHNVIAGLFDILKGLNKNSKLYGFLGGPSGLIDGEYVEITKTLIDKYRNTGGFDIIGSGRTKLETPEQFDAALENCRKLDIAGLVVIGGDDSNTNACVMAEYFAANEAGVQVVGCPKTIDGDLKNAGIETSFGFDTATKVYGELIGNILRDALSAKKYYHFIKLMGRSASHIALECALQTHANITLISEEVAEKKWTLQKIVEDIAKVVAKRAEEGKNFGVVLVPEGLIEFVPEMKKLIGELNDLLAESGEYFASIRTFEDQAEFVTQNLTATSAKVFGGLPRSIREQLLMDRDPHGNVQVSRIETEKLLIEMVGELLDEWKTKGKYKGKFSPQSHFFGYEGRCAPPSNFDADYCYALGYTAGLLLGRGCTGYIASVAGLARKHEKWTAGGVPLTSLMTIERRHGKDKPVIEKALVELKGKPFKTFAAARDTWAIEDDYLFPGPIQYFGPGEVSDQPTETLKLESK
jgi:pyrophosphate--fructose-6-phosphate 1-phosphotransferase